MIERLLKPNRVEVAGDLSRVTTRDAALEVEPASVQMSDAQVELIWKRIEQLYQTGLQPAISFVLRRQGRIVMRRSIGHAALGTRGPREAALCTPETPICLFSASKAVTAMLVHKLVEQRQIDLDDRIARYIPAYGVEGKASTTVRHLLAHRAGIPRVKPGTDPAILFDWNAVVKMLCAAKPISSEGEVQSYHAITGGFILGELVQRVSGLSLRDYLAEHISKPMGLDVFSYGLPESRHRDAALNYVTGPKPWFPLTTYVQQILGAPFERVVEVSNSPEFLSAVIPAGNLYATADGIGAFFEMMLSGGQWNGRQIFKPETIAEAVRPAGPIHVDRTLFVPVRFSAGMVLGEWPFGLYGRDCRSAYGHLGFLTTICWADPARDISVAFLNTGKSVSMDQLRPLVRVLGTISRACKPLAYSRRAVD